MSESNPYKLDNKQPCGLYSIENFNTERGRPRGHYGFSIVLAEPCVAALLEAAPRDPTAPLAAMLRDRVVKSLVNGRLFPPAFHFVGETWMLASFNVAGDCACFGIGGDKLERLEQGRACDVRFDPHNIDTPEQAATILSTWLLWFNMTLALTPLQLPFTF